MSLVDSVEHTAETLVSRNDVKDLWTLDLSIHPSTVRKHFSTRLHALKKKAQLTLNPLSNYKCQKAFREAN